MSDRGWQDIVVGDRMAVDQEFSKRVAESEFSRQEWGLVMTAVELEIEHPEDAERARIVADTSKVEQVLPEMENIRSQMGAMGAGGQRADGSDGGGIFDSVKDALGLGGGGSGGGADQERLRTADRLAQEYADELQERLESQGKWARVREAAGE